MPDWLKKIRSLVDCKHIAQAQKLLDEKRIQKQLANINDINIGVFVRYTVADLLDRTGQVDRAAQYHSDMLDKIPDASNTKEIATIYAKTGLLYAKHGKCTQAIDNLSKAKELDPDNINTLNNLAGSIMKIGRLEEAIALLREALAINPQYKDAYSNLLFNLNYLPGANS